MQKEKQMPFSKSYVLRTTAKHMKKSIDISIRKTVERMPEFDGNRDKSLEVLSTIAELYALKKRTDEYQSQFKDESSIDKEVS